MQNIFARIFHKCLATQKFDEKTMAKSICRTARKTLHQYDTVLDKLRKCIERRTANFRFCGEKGTPHSKVRTRKSDETNMINCSGKRKLKSSCEKCNEKGKILEGFVE